MVSLITGRKGSGKTKRLIEQVNKAVEASSGNVVCASAAEIMMSLQFSLKRSRN